MMIYEILEERCGQQIFDEECFKETTKTKYSVVIVKIRRRGFQFCRLQKCWVYYG